MFGYIRPHTPELRVREYEYYKAVYCGLCRSMGKCTGQCSRMTLSYDFAFLSLVRMALSGTVPAFRRRRCFVHPLRKRNCMEPNGESDYCARAAAILSFEKCRDDVADERGMRRFRARLRCLFLHGAYRRAKKKLPDLAAGVREALCRLSALEKERHASVDEPAAVFGDLLALIVSYDYEGDRATLAAHIGRTVGKFIYIADAADDYEKDVNSGSYNPFALLYKGGFTAEARTSAEVALRAELCDLEEAFLLLPETICPEQKEILCNILYLGMPATVKKVLYGAPKEEK